MAHHDQVGLDIDLSNERCMRFRLGLLAHLMIRLTFTKSSLEA